MLMHSGKALDDAGALLDFSTLESNTMNKGNTHSLYNRKYNAIIHIHEHIVLV